MRVELLRDDPLKPEVANGSKQFVAVTLGVLDVLNAATISFEQFAQCCFTFRKWQKSQVFTQPSTNQTRTQKPNGHYIGCEASQTLEHPYRRCKQTTASMIAVTLILLASSTIRG